MDKRINAGCAVNLRRCGLRKGGGGALRGGARTGQATKLVAGLHRADRVPPMVLARLISRDVCAALYRSAVCVGPPPAKSLS